ncbi:MAG: hypothetical protein R3249_09695 [Nitriliruptorales bacterium]|nr:hypothetical protein [Nitriliruptorales bacterium]
MRPALIPAALTILAAATAVVAMLPDGSQRASVMLDHVDLSPAGEVDAAAILTDALLASSNTAFEGVLTVVGIDGPSVFQMAVEAGRDGTRTVDTGSWVFGSTGETVWASSDDGHWLERGAAGTATIDVDALLLKYDVAVAGVRRLPTGDAWLLVVTDRATQIQREWLSVDVATGLLVRRETFADDSAAVRLVAFETLRTSGRVVPLHAPTSDAPPSAESVVPTWNGIDIAELPGQYQLMEVTRTDGEHLPPVALVFTDGLYHLSVYPLPGELDRGQLAGAVADGRDGLHLYRWPGAEPQRLVWSGDGHTFTAITDAPLDAVLPALARFPRDPEPGPLTRMRRGLERVADTLWPF